MPGGALGVERANEIVPLINRLILKFDYVLATQDWHPPHHISFASTHHKQVGDVILIEGREQVLWPDHCIQNSRGADFANGLQKEKIRAVFHKGTDPKIDSYSAFFDNARKRHTGLAKHLQTHLLKNLYFVGVATDYCVLYSVLDALELGFNTWVIQDACRPINLRSGDEERALDLMRSQGAKIIVSDDLRARS